MRIAVLGRKLQEEFRPFTAAFLRSWISQGYEVILHKDLSDWINLVEPGIGPQPFSDTLPEGDFALLISLGGDGTLLEASTYTVLRDIPLMGINMGRLGFLASIGTDEAMDIAKAFKSGAYAISSRTLIELFGAAKWFGQFPYGLNEMAIMKRDSASMIVIHTYFDDNFLNSYWADGLIISTPTGSTGYSLSCGGALVHPSTSTIILSPVCPHTLTVRPIVLPDSGRLRFEVEARGNQFLVSLDSRSVVLPSGSVFEAGIAPKRQKIIEIGTYNYFKTLRKKLNWGLDSRN